jgi:uncharacterized hydrophobic protein (TIGR00271 family)
MSQPIIPKEPENNAEQIKKGANHLFSGISGFFRELTDLQSGLDREGTVINIKNNKRMRGANVWLLMCSIMVASLGLDLNSPAVIIGAMLISPLMSPILGIGLSIGINDRSMLWIALQHFGISIIIALITSFIYFKLTPLGEITPEISSRTAPTFLDVLVAFFGGVAGIISGSRKDQSNAIPGVAIATALMPPLCVTGFGLATGEWEIMLNSFYLFFLNAVFVALATYLIVRLLNFELVDFADPMEKRRTRVILVLVSALLITPSFFILSNVLEKLNEKRKIEDYLTSHFEEAIWETGERHGSDSLEVKLILFDQIEEDSIARIKGEFNELNCQARLSIIQSEIPKSEINVDELQANLRNDMLSLIDTKQKIETEKDRQIQQLQFQIDSIRSDTVLFANLMKEIPIFFPDIREMSFSMMQTTDFKNGREKLPTLLIKWPPRKTTSLRNRDETKLYEFIKIRADLDTLKIVGTN